MSVKKVMVTGVYGLIAGLVYKRLAASPERYDVYGLARRREPSDRVPEGRRIQIPDEKFTLSDLSNLGRLTADMVPRPRNIYASSKVWSESLARTYADSHGLSCICLRIGWVPTVDRPPNRRGLGIWCSHRDIAAITECCINAPNEVRFDIFFGLSQSDRQWIDMEHAREVIGYVAQDKAEDFIGLEEN